MGPLWVPGYIMARRPGWWKRSGMALAHGLSASERHPVRYPCGDALRTLGSILNQASAAALGAGALELAQHLFR